MEPDRKDIVEENKLSEEFTDRLVKICQVLSYIDDKHKDDIE